MRSSKDLEIYRERFLASLGTAQTQLAGQNEFLAYWKMVEREAQVTEELGKLEGWVKALASDREKMVALKERLEKVEDPNARAIVNMIVQLLDILEGIYKKLKRRLYQRREFLGWLLLRAGPGVKKKVPKGGPGGPGQKDEKDEKASETVLAKPKPKAKKPTKKMTR